MTVGYSRFSCTSGTYKHYRALMGQERMQEESLSGCLIGWDDQLTHL